MKKLIAFLVLLTVILSANDLKWVDEQVNAIKPPRSGVSNSVIKKVQDPFIFLKKNSTKKVKEEKPVVKSVTPPSKIKQSDSGVRKIIKQPIVYTSSSFILGMIINESALINGKWYKVGDSVNNYKIIKIAKSSVTLKQNSKIKVISTQTENNNLKFKN